MYARERPEEEIRADKFLDGSAESEDDLEDDQPCVTELEMKAWVKKAG